MSPELAKISNAKNDLVGDFRTFDLGLIGKLPIFLNTSATNKKPGHLPCKHFFTIEHIYWDAFVDLTNLEELTLIVSNLKRIQPLKLKNLKTLRLENTPLHRHNTARLMFHIPFSNSLEKFRGKGVFFSFELCKAG